MFAAVFSYPEQVCRRFLRFRTGLLSFSPLQNRFNVVFSAPEPVVAVFSAPEQAVAVFSASEKVATVFSAPEHLCRRFLRSRTYCDNLLSSRTGSPLQIRLRPCRIAHTNLPLRFSLLYTLAIGNPIQNQRGWLWSKTGFCSLHPSATYLQTILLCCYRHSAPCSNCLQSLLAPESRTC